MARIDREIKRNLPSYFQSSGIKAYADDATFVSTKGSAAAAGDAYFNTTTGFVKVYTGSDWVNVITEDATGDTSITNDLVVGGDLTVNGTTTTINTATLDVEDVNITINNNGNQATADGAAGLTVEMSDATDATIIYDSTLTSRFKIGDAGSESEVIVSAGDQTLSTKTIGNYLDFTPQGTAPTATAGRLYYDDTEEALTFINEETEISIDLGRELWVRARNSTGSTITKGSAVYVLGSTGNRPTIALADADNVTSAQSIGLAGHDIENNTDGYIIEFGKIKDIDTSAFTAGDRVYLSQTAGQITTTLPSAPAYPVSIGIVVRSSATQGSILVRVEDLVGTNFTSGSVIFVNGSTLTEDNTNFFWDDANNRLGIGTNSPATSIHTTGTIRSGSLSTSNRVLIADANADITESGITVPAVTDTMALLAETQTLTNKTIGDELTFDEIATPSAPAADQVQLYAMDNNGLTELQMQDSTGFISRINEELYETVRNTSGSTINKGQVLRVTGTTGSVPTVALAQANSGTTMPAVAVAAEDITNNSFGRANIIGPVENIDMSAFTDGDILYVSETTAGAFTNTKPSLPNLQQPIGLVVNNGVGNGIVYVNIFTIDGNETGTVNNAFSIGDTTSGNKDLVFKGTSDGTLRWNPSGANTVTIPDATGTIALDDSQDFSTYINLENQGEIRFSEQTGNGTNYVGFEAPDAVTSNQIWKLPDGDGNANQVLSTDGAGNLDWSDGGGGGGTGKNYISQSNSGFESGVGDWATFDDASAFVDGTGGTASNLTLSVTTTAGQVLADTQSASLAKGAADAQYEGISVSTETIDREDFGKTLSGTLSIDTSDANYASGDLRLFAYDVTNGAELLVRSSFSDTNEIPSSTTPQTLGFQVYLDGTSGAETAQVRLSLMVNSTNATAWTVYLDSVTLGPEGFLPGAIITEPKSFEIADYSVGFGTVTNNTFEYTRIGSFAHVKGKFTMGTITSNLASLELPTSLTPKDKSQIIKGRWWNTGNTGAARKSGPVWIEQSSSPNIIFFGSDTDSSTFVPYSSGAVTDYFANGDTVEVDLTFEVDGWEASNLISTTENLFKNAKARYNTNAGQSIPTATTTIINFEDQVYDDANLVTTGASWKYTAVEDQVVSVKTRVQFLSTVNWSTGESVLLQIYKNGTLYSQIDQLEIENSAGESLVISAGGSDDVELNAGDTFDVRLYQDTGSSLSLSSNPEFNFISITPNPDLTTFGVYKQEEEINTQITSTTTTSSADTYVDVTGSSITLPQGKWRVHINGTAGAFNASGGNLSMNGEVVMTDSSNNRVNRSQMALQYTLSANASLFRLPISRTFTITVTEETTYKLRIRSSVSSASGIIYFIGGTSASSGLADPDNYSEIWAERIL